jgi:hydrogenase large subunit
VASHASLTATDREPVRRVALEPVARVAGALSFHATVDGSSGTVSEAYAAATLFRGYEAILVGRDVRDAVFVSSRACGACGGAHATCSALALEMAFGIAPPPMAIAVRNLMSALEGLYDLPLQLFTRAGPDYSEGTVHTTSPDLWQGAQQAAAPRSHVHGFTRIADIMSALTTTRGELYVEALAMARLAGEAYVVIGGKHPHPETIVPGGVSSTIDTSDLNALLLRVVKLLDYAQKAVSVWDDLVGFLFEADPGYRELGAGAKNFIELGQWDDPLAYDGRFENCAAWGTQRWATPGVIVDGRLLTTSLPEINQGVEEFVDHSFYEPWPAAGEVPTDQLGNELPANHPAVKQTLPRPGERSFAGRYSWSTAPRWKGQAMETGAAARLWSTALADELPHRRFIEPTGSSLRLAMPQGALPATELEWRAPERWGTLERNRAQAYALAYTALVAFDHALAALDLKRKGEQKMSAHFPVPRDPGAGIGLWGTPRGYLSHHVNCDRGVIERYQILGPSTWTMSPRDASGTPGPCEQAVMAAPLVSREPGADAIDILRTLRSFSPCMPCATH